MKQLPETEELYEREEHLISENCVIELKVFQSLKYVSLTPGHFSIYSWVADVSLHSIPCGMERFDGDMGTNGIMDLQ